jgi:hypothetical protein
MKIREINVDNVISFLNSNDYSLEYLSNSFRRTINSFGSRDYVNFLYRFVDFFYDNRTEFEFEPPDKYIGTPVFINEIKTQKILKYLNKLTFNRMYPVIINKLYKAGEVDFNIIELGQIYSFVADNYISIRTHKDITKESSILLKIFINYLFGMSHNTFKTMGINNIHKVIDYYRNTVEELSKIDGVIYVDCDTIYFEELYKDDVLKIVDVLDIPYEIEDVIASFFIQKKKYISIENNDVIVRGLNTNRIKRNSYNQIFYDVIEKFKNELLKQKINKLKELCVKEQK